MAGKSDKAYRKLSVNYGGGKTHTLITLRHLVHDPATLPDLPAVKEFEASIGSKAPKARVAALCFDKIDLEKGVETPSPNGAVRMLKHPWSILAFQLAGADGLKLIHADGKDAERDTPPAEPLVVELLSKPQQDDLSTLVLLDEVLMYIRAQVEAAADSRGRLISFFQYLTQAVVKVDRCAMVASLLASDPRKHDAFGNELLRDVSEVFGRQMEEDASPVSKEDVAEVLRRRFFKPESISDPGAFRPHVTSVVSSIAALDEQTRKERGSAEERYLSSYPFHPDLSDVFYTRWTQLDGFQRTRGILRTFAIALRDAEKWDTSPLVGPNVFLNEPDENDLAEAASELASFASVDTDTGKHQEWRPILEGELAKARTIQSETTGLGHREIEQAVVAVFLSSQPIGHKALTQELMVLIGSGQAGQNRIGKGPASLDGTVLVSRRGGGLHWRYRLTQGVAAGQSPQPTADAPRCLYHPRIVPSRRSADHRCHRATEGPHVRGVRSRRKGPQPAGKTARHRGRWRVPLRSPRPASRLRVWQTKRRSQAVHQRDDCAGPSPSPSQRHRPRRSFSGRSRRGAQAGAGVSRLGGSTRATQGSAD